MLRKESTMTGWGLFAVLVVGIVLPESTFALSWEKVYERARPAIPIILAAGGVCSGALMASDTVLTAAHCVDKLRTLRVIWPTQDRKTVQARVVHLDNRADVAFLRLEEPVAGVTPLAFADFESDADSVKPGQPVATIGHPVLPMMTEVHGFREDNTYLISSGIVSRVNDGEIVIDASVSPGNSGGPLLNSEGEVIGVTSKKLVGLGVGNIGYASGLKTFAEAWDKLREGRLVEPVSPLLAKTSFDLGLSFEQASWLPAAGTDNVARSFYWSWNLKDRLIVRYESLFGASGMSDTKWGLGWKFAHDVAYLRSVSVTPLVEWVDLQYAGFQGEVVAFSIVLDAATLPFWVKFSSYTILDEAQTSLAIGLDLF